MTLPRPTIAGCRRRTRKVSAAVALVAFATLCDGAAHASCLELTQPGIQPLQELSLRNPKQAIETATAAIETAGRATPPDEARMAALYAVEAQSYSLLELDSDAREAALKGLQFARQPNDSTHLTLQMVYAENVYDTDGINAALAAIEKARSLQLPGSRADLCLQITIGRVQHRSSRPDLALLTLTQAYHASQSFAAAEPRVAAADALSPVMRGVGDFKQALALNQEVIDWETQHDATLSLSVAHYLRGKILSEMHDYNGALEQTEWARRLSVELSDEQGIGFADLATCRMRVELGQLGAARSDCESAVRIFTTSHRADMQREAQTLLARLDLTEGHLDHALSRLNEVLGKSATEMQPRQIPSAYQLRAQANAALQRYPQAYRDLTEYLRRFIAHNAAERAQQVAALRARFETDREIERNAALQRELGLAEERAQEQRTVLRWVAAGIGVSIMVIALLTYLLAINRRYRRELVRLATEDSLTGLPNRGRTATLAIKSLLTACDSQQPLCVALIDLDRFKAINDRFGHATGDRVLQEFAAIAAAAIRPTDILGRWGGEEFLLILPNTTLDIGVAILDHLRLQAGLIRPCEEESELRVSLSAGLATTTAEPCSLDEIVARADLALYEAKNAGRDLVRFANESFLSASTGTRRALRQATRDQA